MENTITDETWRGRGKVLLVQNPYPEIADLPSILTPGSSFVWVQHKESLESLASILPQFQHQRMADLVQPFLLPLADLIFERSRREDRSREWEWDGGPKVTITSEWGLICGEAYKSGLVASVFFLGYLVGELPMQHSVQCRTNTRLPSL